jgi:AraC-like DNA-binding protein
MKKNLQFFTTDLVPVSDRREAWLLNARQFCGDCKFQFPMRLPFRGSIERRNLTNLEMTLFSSSSISFHKFPSEPLNSANRVCIVISQLAGLRSYRQDGNVAVLKKGDVTLIDSGRPWSSDCPGDCARLYLRIPWQLMQSRLRLKELPVAKRISGDAGLGRLLFQLSTSLYREAGRLTEAEGGAAIEAHLRILAECVRSPVCSCGHQREEQLEKILSYIDAHLTDASLNPSEIARAAELSARHLHRLFAHRGMSVSDWIRLQRLGHCKNDLANPLFDEKSITEVAFFWGFNDSAHFSRAFKQEFGVSPRGFRTRVQEVSARVIGVRKAAALLGLPPIKHLRAS